MTVHSPTPLLRISTLYPVKPSVADGETQRSFNPSALLSATNLLGAWACTAGATVSVGWALAETVGSVDCEIEGVGAGAASSLLPADFDHTIAAKIKIPAITTKTTLPEVLCLGAAAGFATTVAGLGATDATGAVLTSMRATGVLTEACFTTRFAGAFLATAFLAADFLAVVFLTADFLAAGFLAADFLATVFLAVLFLATAFLTARFAGAFFATFLTALFFFTATITPWIAVRTQTTYVDGARLPQPF